MITNGLEEFDHLAFDQSDEWVIGLKKMSGFSTPTRVIDDGISFSSVFQAVQPHDLSGDQTLVKDEKDVLTKSSRRFGDQSRADHIHAKTNQSSGHTSSSSTPVSVRAFQAADSRTIFESGSYMIVPSDIVWNGGNFVESEQPMWRGCSIVTPFNPQESRAMVLPMFSPGTFRPAKASVFASHQTASRSAVDGPGSSYPSRLSSATSSVVDVDDWSECGDIESPSSKPSKKQKTEKIDFSMDFQQKPRRKASENARKILLTWLVLNQTNPYPNRRQKQELAETTGMTLKQIVHWMSNVRKRRFLPLLSGKRAPSSKVDVKFLEEVQQIKQEHQQEGW